MEGLSDSNPGTENGGGRENCPIVTPASTGCDEGKQDRRGAVNKLPIFIREFNKKNLSHLSSLR